LKYWNIYIAKVKHICASSEEEKNLAYWRDNLFASIMIYLLPFCSIALLPGTYLSFFFGRFSQGVVNILTAMAMPVVAFMPGISMPVRKAIFVGSMFVLGCSLLYNLGLYGPGLVYLLAVCIFSILIFPSAYAFWPAFLNTFICIFFAIALKFHVITWPLYSHRSVGEWLGVYSNLVFLSFLCAALIPKLFNGLQETIDNEKQVRGALNMQQQSLKKALNTLEQKNIELEQFTHFVSHDLLEPLRMVTGFLTQIEKKYRSIIDDRGKQYIHFAVDGAKRMRMIILDLLEFSSIGKAEENKKDVNLNKLVQEIQMLLQKQIAEKKAIIDVSQLPVIHTYTVLLMQVFQNLISNALKYSKEGTIPHIKISVTPLLTHWQFGVADNGIGIREEYFDKIFIIFQRLHNKDVYEGTGIGLAITKKIVESLGGNIWVESEERKGSIFYFTIPKNN